MQRRAYGATGESLSIVGFGGIVVMSEGQADANAYAAAAFERGVNYFDVAPGYGDAQDRLGPAISGFRDEIFLACKTEKRIAAEATVALEDSLRRVGTDRFDLYQLHGVATVEEAERCLAPGGAVEALVQARDAGKARFLGFSAHSEDAALLLLEQFPFTSVLFPFTVRPWLAFGFGRRLLDVARQKGVACLALKAMAAGPWPDGAERVQPKCWYQPHPDPRDAADGLRWTLGLGVTAAIPPGDAALFNLAMDVADGYVPMTTEERADFESRTSSCRPLFSEQFTG